MDFLGWLVLLGQQPDLAPCRVTLGAVGTEAREKMKKRDRVPFLVTLRCIIAAVVSFHGGKALVWIFQRASFNSAHMTFFKNQQSA